MFSGAVLTLLYIAIGTFIAVSIWKACLIGVRFISKILRRLEQNLLRAAGLAGEAAAAAIAWPFEKALDEADKAVARATEWRALRRTWRQDFRSSMSWADFKAQMAGTPQRDELTDAVSLFGLVEPFTRADLEQRFKKTMFAVHPDKGGSEYLARLANEARVLILDHKGWKK
jgi:hypothetical protein